MENFLDCLKGRQVYHHNSVHSVSETPEIKLLPDHNEKAADTFPIDIKQSNFLVIFVEFKCGERVVAR